MKYTYGSNPEERAPLVSFVLEFFIFFQHISETTNQSVSHLVSQSINQSVDKSINQLISQSIKDHKVYQLLRRPVATGSLHCFLLRQALCF